MRFLFQNMEESACSKCGKRCDLDLPSVASRVTRHICEICLRLSDPSINENSRTTETLHLCHHPHSNSLSSNNECSRLLPDIVLSCEPPRKNSSSLSEKECGRLLKCMADNFDIHRSMSQIKTNQEQKCSIFSKAAMVQFITCFSCLFLKLKNIFPTR